MKLWTDDGWTPDHGHPISSPCEPNGSGELTICIGENKGADQLRGYTAKLISAFVFATLIVQFLLYLTPKFQASSLLLYRPVCVGPVRKPHCWFSHEAAHLKEDILIIIMNMRKC